MAKKFFQENNLPFTDYNVAENRQALTEMIAKSGQMAVPVIEIDGNIIVGFDREKIKQMVGLK
jgi:glutaredoxin